MHWQEQIRAKKWNERVRLIITFLNVTAIGSFGLAVTAPIVSHLALRRPATAKDSPPPWGELKLGGDFTLLDVVLWDMAAVAIALHVFAHMLVSLIERED